MKATQPISTWDALLAGSLLVIAACIVFTFAVPAPTRAQVGVKTRSIRESEATFKRLSEKLEPARNELESRTWDLTPEALGARILESVTKLSEKRGLQVSRFTVGKPVEVEDLLEAKVIVTLDGNFSDVLKTIQELDQPETKFVVADIKLGSTEGIDRVSCILTLAGFIRGEKA